MNVNFNSSNFRIEEIVQDIVRETGSETDDPFLTPYYFKCIDRLRQSEKIIIVGAGFYGRNLYKILKQNNINTVKCFADNACKRYRNGIYDIDVLSLQDAAAQNDGAYFVITPRYYYMDLVRQLLRLGVDVDRIDCFIVSDTGLEI